MANELELNNLQVKETLNKIGYVWIGGKYENCFSKLHVVDDIGYAYIINMHHAKQKRVLKAIHKSNPYAIQNMRLWLNLNRPYLTLLSDSYENAREYMSFKCNDCGDEFVSSWTNISSRLDQKRCKNCSGTKPHTVETALESLKSNSKNIEFTNPRKEVVNGKNNWYVDAKCLENESHGSWKMLLSTAQNGSGCTLCGHQIYGGHGGLNITTAERNEDEWKERECQIYVVEISSEKELFHKIGITTVSTSRRFSKLKGYKVKELMLSTTNLYDAIFKELELHSLVAEKAYKPLNKFEGWTECFKLSNDDFNIIQLELGV